MIPSLKWYQTQLTATIIEFLQLEDCLSLKSRYDAAQNDDVMEEKLRLLGVITRCYLGLKLNGERKLRVSVTGVCIIQGTS